MTFDSAVSAVARANSLAAVCIDKPILRIGSGMCMAIISSIEPGSAFASAAFGLHPAAEGDAGALKRAITNLIDDAVKYGGGARVAVHASSNAIDITVEDDGPGIPDHQITRVFQPFYRLEVSRSRATGGIGLGLTIAASIVEAHGGEPTLRNTSDGGLMVIIHLRR